MTAPRGTFTCAAIGIRSTARSRFARSLSGQLVVALSDAVERLDPPTSLIHGVILSWPCDKWSSRPRTAAGTPCLMNTKPGDGSETAGASTASSSRQRSHSW